MILFYLELKLMLSQITLIPIFILKSSFIFQIWIALEARNSGRKLLIASKKKLNSNWYKLRNSKFILWHKEWQSLYLSISKINIFRFWIAIFNLFYLITDLDRQWKMRNPRFKQKHKKVEVFREQEKINKIKKKMMISNLKQ